MAQTTTKDLAHWLTNAQASFKRQREQAKNEQIRTVYGGEYQRITKLINELEGIEETPIEAYLKTQPKK